MTKKTIDIKRMKQTGAIINLKGKEFVTYKGLLWVAHQHGLQSIKTELVAYDAEANSAIVKAIVTGDRCTCTDFGDANPKNVGRAMVNCIIRMASTRAKARALRDYLGIGICSLEELPETDR